MATYTMAPTEFRNLRFLKIIDKHEATGGHIALVPRTSSVGDSFSVPRLRSKIPRIVASKTRSCRRRPLSPGAAMRSSPRGSHAVQPAHPPQAEAILSARLQTRRQASEFPTSRGRLEQYPDAELQPSKNSTGSGRVRVFHRADRRARSGRRPPWRPQYEQTTREVARNRAQVAERPFRHMPLWGQIRAVQDGEREW